MQALGLVWGDVDSKAAGFQEVFTVMREPSHYDARHLFECWRERNAEGGFVIGQHVPSRALARVMSHLVVYEPLEDAEDFRARLAGTSLLRRFGRDISGSKLSEMFEPDAFEAQRDDMRVLLRTGRPCVLEVKATIDNYPVLHFEIVALPVLAPDRETPWILSGLFYYDWPAQFSRPATAAPQAGQEGLITQLLPRIQAQAAIHMLH
ncbi:MAG TPA: PAS domain-containing protein [Rhizomicrobium sp.]